MDVELIWDFFQYNFQKNREEARHLVFCTLWDSERGLKVPVHR